MWIRKDSNDFKCLNLFIGLNEIGSSEDLRLRKLCDVTSRLLSNLSVSPKTSSPLSPGRWSWFWTSPRFTVVFNEELIMKLIEGEKKHGESDQSAFPTRKLMMNGLVCLAPPCVSAFIYFFMFLPPDSCCQGDPQLYGHQLLCSIRKTKNKSRRRQSNLILSSATVPNDRSS